MQRRKFLSYKEQVIVSRGGGGTYAEIINEIGVRVPKSTLSDWCKGVIMPDWYQQKVDKLNKKKLSKALRVAHVSSELKREKIFIELQRRSEDAMRNISFNGDVCKALLSVLYLGEGAKSPSQGLQLGSTDPNIIKMYIGMLGICYGIHVNELKCRISHRADQDLRTLQEYWSDFTGIPIKNFYKSVPDPRTVGKPTKRAGYKGVCVIYAGKVVMKLELLILSGLILEEAKRAYSSAVEQLDGIE